MTMNLLTLNVCTYHGIKSHLSVLFTLRGIRGYDHAVVGFTTSYTIVAYHHMSCEFEFHSWWVVLSTTLYDKICQWLAAGRWFSLGTPVLSTNETERHDITRLLLKVALDTITLTLNKFAAGEKKMNTKNTMHYLIQKTYRSIKALITPAVTFTVTTIFTTVTTYVPTAIPSLPVSSSEDYSP